MSKKEGRTKFHFSIENQPLYPHMKLTAEAFPRLLSTRKIADDGAEYFGPFLNRSAARILIDFLNQTFRLRTCYIDIDGNFDVPCTQYYAKRCIAPCVKSLCSVEEYEEMVGLTRLFLQNHRDWFESEIRQLIEVSAGDLDFEKAAFFRDVLRKVNDFWKDKRRQVWIDDTVDTLVLEENQSSVTVYLVTTRGQRMLGSRVFVFPPFPGVEAEQALADVIEQLYRIHSPREIRVSRDFFGRKEMSRDLSKAFGRTVKIAVLGEDTAPITAVKALIRTKHTADLDSIKSAKSLAEIRHDLKKIFRLAKLPLRIEAFDAAHISGTSPSAAMSVWDSGKFVNAEYESSLSDQKSELDTLREFVARRFRNDGRLPDLVVIDGGTSHLRVALEAVGSFTNRRFAMIGAVKPRGKHSEISHFILADGSRVNFEPDNEAMRILQVLRDDSHELANATHRQSRDMGYYYELAGILPSLNERERQTILVKFGSIKRIIAMNAKDVRDAVGDLKLPLILGDLQDYKNGKAQKVEPLIVPICYDDPIGDASDLRPIRALQKSTQKARQ